MIRDPESLLRELFTAAIDAAHPRQVLVDHLPADRSGRAIVIGAGKAAAAMAKAIEAAWEGEISGLVVTRYGHGADCRKIEVVEAAHPVPDDAGERVARRVLEMVSNLDESDRVIFLLSGGGSSLLALPALKRIRPGRCVAKASPQAPAEATPAASSSRALRSRPGR